MKQFSDGTSCLQTLLDKAEVTHHIKRYHCYWQHGEFAPGDRRHGIQLQATEEGIMGTSLLGEHVADQVAHTVAVAELVVVPADQRRTAGEDLGSPKKKGGSNGAVNSP